jgi:hypothetical protein
MTAGPDRLPPTRGGGDSYALWDAAYVLGALSPSDRLEFEEHLATCSSCQGAVAEIAGVPGLLAQVGPEDAAQLTESTAREESMPAEVLPAVLTQVSARRQRMTRLLVGLAAATVLVLGGFAAGSGVLSGGDDEPRRLAFASVGPTNITAVVDLVPVSDGTQLDVECQYGGATAPDPDGHYARYSIVVTDRFGRSSTVKDWPVSPNKVMRPSGRTPLQVSQISDVEIQVTATKATVLRASVH